MPWHGCPEHGNVPNANRIYWPPKLERNAARDAEINLALRAAGWTVVRVWEHERLPDATARVESHVSACAQQ